MNNYPETAPAEAARSRKINDLEIAVGNIRDDCKPEIDQNKVIIIEPIMIREDRSKPKKPSSKPALSKRIIKLIKWIFTKYE